MHCKATTLCTWLVGVLAGSYKATESRIHGQIVDDKILAFERNPGDTNRQPLPSACHAHACRHCNSYAILAHIRWFLDRFTSVEKLPARMLGLGTSRRWVITFPCASSWFQLYIRAREARAIHSQVRKFVMTLLGTAMSRSRGEAHTRQL